MIVREPVPLHRGVRARLDAAFLRLAGHGHRRAVLQAQPPAADRGRGRAARRGGRLRAAGRRGGEAAGGERGLGAGRAAAAAGGAERGARGGAAAQHAGLQPLHRVQGVLPETDQRHGEDVQNVSRGCALHTHTITHARARAMANGREPYND